MRTTREIEVEGRKVTVKELTIAEIRGWLKDLEKRSEETNNADPVSALLFEQSQMWFADIALMTDLKASDCEALTPTQLKAIMQACRELNESFFSMRDRLMGIGSAILAQQGSGASEATSIET